MAPRTTRITVETETLLVVRRAKAARAWCSACAAEVDVIVLPTASLSDPDTAVQVQQCVDSGNLHLWKSPEGPINICVVSLLQSPG